MKFDWLVHSVKCPHLSTTNYNLQKGYFGDIHQFIAHCLITLDPCIYYRMIKYKNVKLQRNDNQYFFGLITMYDSTYIREVGDIGMFITLVPKVLQYFFLLFGLTTLGKLVHFDCFFIGLSVHIFQPLIMIYRSVILCSIIVVVHQMIFILV